MKRRMVALLVVSLMLLMPLLAGAETKLTIWNSSQTMVDFYKENVWPEFQKLHPEVTELEVLYMPIQDYVKKLAIALPSGDVPDVMEIEDSWATPYVTAGYFEENTPELNALLDQMYPELKNTVTYEDKAYGVPVAPFHEMMFYNLDMMKEAGVDQVPDTIDELIDAAVKMTKRDDAGMVTQSGFSMRLGGNPGGTSQKFWVLALLGNGVDIYEESETQPGKYHAGFNNEGGYNALKLYIDLLYKYKVDDFSSMKDTAAFAAGKAAINMREPSASASIMTNGPDINWTSGPMPIGTKQRATFLITLNLYVPIDSKNKDLARDFITLASGREMQSVQASKRAGYNPYADVDPTVGLDARLQPSFVFPENMKVYTVPVQNAYDTIMVKIGEALPNILQKSELLDNPEGIKAEIEALAKMVDDTYRDFDEYGE